MIFLKAREYVLTFGKYKGETLEEVYIEDVAYLDWILETNDSEFLKTKIKECFKEMRSVRIYK